MSRPRRQHSSAASASDFGQMMEQLELLRHLSFGAQVAEDETGELASYFVETDQWQRIRQGDIDIVRGEKGAGKSAIYSLLVARTDEFFDENILLISAERPRGATVFKELVSDPPTSESGFVSLWKLYIATLIAMKLKEFDFSGSAARKLIRTLEAQSLLEQDWDLSRLFRNVVSYTKGWLQPDIVEGSFSADPGTGAPIFGIKIKPSAGTASTTISVDELLDLANEALRLAGRSVWVLMDRLDVAFAETHELETNALRALFRVYRDLSGHDYIKLKIFLRSDIWKRITEGGFREASHITRFVTLEWSNESLLNLIVRRLLSNSALLINYAINKEDVLKNFDAQRKLFYDLFPSQVEQGTKKRATLEWIISRCADGNNKTAPREVIHLLTSLREQEIARMERGEEAPVGRQLFDRSVFKAALPSVSETRLFQNLYAEYPELKPRLSKLEGQKTEQTLESLRGLWACDGAEAAKWVEKLVGVAFFQQRGSKGEETYWVPFLYRDALKMSQGLAED